MKRTIQQEFEIYMKASHPDTTPVTPGYGIVRAAFMAGATIAVNRMDDAVSLLNEISGQINPEYGKRS